MAFLEHDDARLHYTDTGSGFPVLVIAPGGMRSTIDKWAAMPWNPLEALADSYRIIAMDQRNAGASRAPISADDGWHTYTADHLALLDHLGVDRCHVIGMCIGGPYSLALAMAAPERIASAVLLQPIGIDDNRLAFEQMFDGWAAEVGPDHPEADAETFASFRENMYGGDFVFVASPDQVAEVETPLLVAMGDDPYHPQSVSREIARRAPDATFLERWKDDEVAADTHAAISAFLAANTDT